MRSLIESKRSHKKARTTRSISYDFPLLKYADLKPKNSYRERRERQRRRKDGNKIANMSMGSELPYLDTSTELTEQSGTQDVQSSVTTVGDSVTS